MLNLLERRIIDISYKKGLSHIGSCLSCVNTIDKIYSVKKPNEPFILSNGHAALALYVVLEKYEGHNAEELFDKHGVHPNRDAQDGIWASTGSLGHGIGIAVGMALADRKQIVNIMGSDGDVNEGSWYEALRIAADLRLENLRIVIIANGYSAYDEVDQRDVDNRLNVFYPTLVIRTNMFKYPDFLQGQQAHYVIMNKEQYKEVLHEA